MKTRILITALMIILTTVVIAEPSHNKSEDSLYTSHMAIMSGANSLGTTEYSASSGVLPSGVTIKNAANLEEWVETREAWEKEATAGTNNMGMVIVNLEEWISNLESWEQESSSSDLASVAYTTTNLEEWVSERETWEQSMSESDLSALFNGAFYQEWFHSRETWEQK